MTLFRLFAFALLPALITLVSTMTHAQQVPQSRAEMAMSFSPVVKETAPSVVNVYAKRIVQTQQVSPFGADPFFRRFFGDREFGGRPRERAQNSLGSGVIVDASGIVVTNNHVIKGGTEIRVVLSDKREFDAELVLTDERTDLAVLKIKPDGDELIPLPLGDSDALEVGDLVLAIGNPFGVGQTVTSGIVSALARTRVGVSSYQFFIQTDAAINPGNSGGALVGMDGRLVGINTAIFSRSGGSNGIGFAIPVNMVRSVIEQSLGGASKVVRPWVGADLQDVTADLAAALKLNRPRGAIISTLHPESPLGKAGLKQGDVLLRLADRQIENAQEFSFRFATMSVGKSEEVVFSRKNRRYKASVELMAAPEIPARDTSLIGGRSPFTGLEVVNISPAVAEELSLPTSAEGVAVGDVKGRVAQRFGFKKGDVIVELNDRKLKSVRDFKTVLANPVGYWAVAVLRNGKLIRREFGG
ncbi:MAG: DegQ family serine endoprotease [Anderseniella sp.]